MHDHDLDLIAEYAANHKDNSSPAASLVMSCPECRAEYNAQRRVLDWLAEAPSVSMTADERASLHARLAPVVAKEGVVTPLRPLTRRLLLVSGSVAAVLLAVVALGTFNGPVRGVFSDLAGGVASATTAAAELAMPTAGSAERSAENLGEITDEELATFLTEADRQVEDNGLSPSSQQAEGYDAHCQQTFDSANSDFVAYARLADRPIEIYEIDAGERRREALYADDCSEVPQP